MPGVFDKTMGYVNYLKPRKEIVSNIIQGPFLGRKFPFEGEILLRRLMYFDDYQNNNPLGSHKGI